METSEKNQLPEEFDDDEKRPKIWGPFYLILGIAGLGSCLYQGFYDLGDNIVPLYGTVVAEVLIAALSLLMIVYGYRIMRRDI